MRLHRTLKQGRHLEGVLVPRAHRHIADIAGNYRRQNLVAIGIGGSHQGNRLGEIDLPNGGAVCISGVIDCCRDCEVRLSNINERAVSHRVHRGQAGCNRRAGIRSFYGELDETDTRVPWIAIDGGRAVNGYVVEHAWGCSSIGLKNHGKSSGRAIQC